jgi:hypothetical protein
MNREKNGYEVRDDKLQYIPETSGKARHPHMCFPKTINWKRENTHDKGYG